MNSSARFLFADREPFKFKCAFRTRLPPIKRSPDIEGEGATVAQWQGSTFLTRCWRDRSLVYLGQIASIERIGIASGLRP
jgi:hypothetical protein